MEQKLGKQAEGLRQKLVPYVTAMSAINAEYADFAAKADVEISKANASVTKKAKTGETTAAE